ncbi:MULTISPECIES: RNB domain-containing ribonuclease [unclassified Roseateles]|uniref:RNB domain-containing ribonuclease n=1 Tax=unclassified Roseateles TaxID=2626991 RepID=UPI0006F6B944|nr:MULTISPECIES: RNB domain-containing ribonuclease [unclassified Roseateles]KQW44842.1 ribonuclease II [Pelomonas sp. Root405]KRA70201.1 ribonuclease II [Pelomonas sp. Root662]
MTDDDLHRLAEDALRERGFLPRFSPGALAEAQDRRRTGPLRPGDARDLRQLAWFSIDNDDTRDLDQLSVAEPLRGGATRLLVAVADVEAFVPVGSALDEHAAVNTTSVYTAAGVYPMLPETLSTDLSSLHEGEERLAVVVDLRVEADGAVSGASLYAAIVVNHAKLAYDAVSAWLADESLPLPRLDEVPRLAEQLRLHDALAARLARRRHEHGALNMTTASARPVFAGGRLVDLRADEKNRAKDLIAELMIAANSATARFLDQHGFPSLRRFLRAPQRWDRIEALAALHGGRLPDEPDAAALDRFLSRSRQADPAGFADLSLAVVKLLGAGEYLAAGPTRPGQGHFGLAVHDYAHTTAPNRRFPDLVMQRLVKAALAGKPPPYTVEALDGIARHCTEQQGRANAVERQVLKAAAAFLLDQRIGEVFDAVVTGVASKGTFVRLRQPLVEGRVMRGFEGLDVGDTTRVRLVAVDPHQGHIDFEGVA